MPLTISNVLLRAAGISAEAARVEIAHGRHLASAGGISSTSAGAQVVEARMPSLQSRAIPAQAV
jgi:hypothetical protein